MTLPTAFASDKHPRGAHGRFAGIDNKAGPSFSNAPLVERGVPGRSPTRGERWQRTGALFAPAHGEIPIGYTGNREKEHTTGTMLVHEFKPQIPAKMPVKDWMDLTGKLTAVANENMKPTLQNVVENGIKVPTHKFSGPKHKTWKPPPGTHRQSLVRAYIHGTKLALHDYGVAKYDFAMDDHLKAEMKPLEPFIRHVVKKLTDRMNVATPGQQWRPFRREFGVPFKTPKYDKQTGEERLRMRPNQELVKRFPTVTILRKAAPPPPPTVPKPGVLAANPMLSRFARYRAEVAHDESMGVHDMKMLTPAQKLQRLHAGIALRRKIQSGAPKLLPGQPGSIAGLHIKRPPSPNAPVAPAGAKAR